MKTTRNKLLVIPIVLSTVFFSCTKFAPKKYDASMDQNAAVNSKYFYYYQNQKRPLVLNTEYIHVVSKKALSGNYRNLGEISSEVKTETVKVGMHQKDGPQKKAVYPGRLKLSKKPSEEEYLKVLHRVEEDPETEYVTPYFEDPQGPQGPHGLIVLEKTFYVKLQSESDVQTLYNVASSYGAIVLEQDEFMPLWWALGATNTSANALDLANAFYQTGLFTYSAPELLLVDPMLCPADEFFPNQWGLKNTAQVGGTAGIDIKACEALDLTRNFGAIIKVAVIDEGVDLVHEDLISPYGNIESRDAITRSWPNTKRGTPDTDHGTAVAGIIGAHENTLGITGVAPNCWLMSTSQSFGPSTRDYNIVIKEIADGINWSWGQGAEVINISWFAVPHPFLSDAIHNALTLGRGGRGCVIVCAAGNSGANTVNYPANCSPAILAVGAVNQCGLRKTGTSCGNIGSWSSSYGAELDVVAPGTAIPTTDWTGELGYSKSNNGNQGKYNQIFDGTSAAAPHVAGVAALVLSRNPYLTATQVRDIIESTAQKIGGYYYNPYSWQPYRPNGGWNPEMGYGLVNAAAAVLATPQPPSGPQPPHSYYATNPVNH